MVPEAEGAMTVISELESTCTPLAAFPPKRTDTVPTKLLPSMISFVVPTDVTFVIVGAGTKSYLLAAVGLLVPPKADTVT